MRERKVCVIIYCACSTQTTASLVTHTPFSNLSHARSNDERLPQQVFAFNLLGDSLQTSWCRPVGRISEVERPVLLIVFARVSAREIVGHAHLRM